MPPPIPAPPPPQGPDLTGIGNAASVSKSAGGGQQLQEFTVKRADAGGVTICETTSAAPPPGRRYGASFQPTRGSYVETPYPDGTGVAEKLLDLLGQLGIEVTAPGAPAEEEAEGEPPPRPPMAAVRGPNVAAARVGPPMRGGY